MKFRKRVYFLVSIIFILLSIVCNAEENSSFETLAPSAILIEQSTGKVLFEKNSNEPRYVASLMKIMNLLIAMEEIESENIKLKDKICIPDNIPSTEGSNIFLKSGEILTIEELIKAISMVSANDACISLARHVSGNDNNFISKMNERSINLGLNNTKFKNCFGFDEEGNISSAHDIAYLASELMKHENIVQYTSSWINHIRDKKTQLVNTNKLLKKYSGTTGLKTGTSKEAGSCICVTADRNNLKLIGVVLGCKDPKERTKEIINLLDYGFSEYSMVVPKIPEGFPKSINIKNGIDSQIEIETTVEESFPISNKKQEKISSEIIFKENLEAPINKGEKVGEIIYQHGDELVYTCDILSKSTVEKIKFLPTFQKLLLNLFAL